MPPTRLQFPDYLQQFGDAYGLGERMYAKKRQAQLDTQNQERAADRMANDLARIEEAKRYHDLTNAAKGEVLDARQRETEVKSALGQGQLDLAREREKRQASGQRTSQMLQMAANGFRAQGIDVLQKRLSVAQVQAAQELATAQAREIYDPVVNPMTPEAYQNLLTIATAHVLGAGRQAPPGAPVRITTRAERDALAPGTRFVGPDGVIRTR